MAISFIILFKPLSKLPQPFSQRDARDEPKIPLQSRCICIRCRYISGLHWHQFLVGLKVVVLGQDAGSKQFFLKDLHKIQQVLRLAVTNVVHGVGGMGRPSSPFLRSGALAITRTIPSTMSSTYVKSRRQLP